MVSRGAALRPAIQLPGWGAGAVRRGEAMADQEVVKQCKACAMLAGNRAAGIAIVAIVISG